ncbi:SDR family NAD(P)-dependent oxidoreductase [Mycobacterium interjectum]|uniref:SDR family NAD(P)-dependent oxidoreductase n=1 Tax=Mycobacterium interjectum TaxID=33895 RepID=UPI0035584282|nr:SDR family NAD(P)-dependent oxidoreductase [Mycobacterium interjectum]
MNNLSGKTALIVGASRGLGRGIALATAAAGASVIAVSRSATTFPEPGAPAAFKRSSPTRPTPRCRAAFWTDTIRSFSCWWPGQPR